MVPLQTNNLASLTDALETLGGELRQVFESIDWETEKLDSRRWGRLRQKMTEFQSLSVLVEARRDRLEAEAAQTLKPWLDRLIHGVAIRALQAEARLAEIQHNMREIPLFGRELFTQALHRLDRLMEQVQSTSPAPEHDQMVIERARHERQDLLELIKRSPDIPDFTALPKRPQRLAA